MRCWCTRPSRARSCSCARAAKPSPARAAETLRAELGEARLAALHSQLAPHFLFNPLNAISTLAVKGESEAVARARSTLAEPLRAVLEERPGHQVAMADELEFLERYLELQQLRFSDRLCVERNIDSDVHEARVPWLLLQPIVENAVQHGLAGSAGGTVTLAARRDGGMLVLEVTDRAAGGGVTARAVPTAGIGLANTLGRLLHLYGDAHALDYLLKPVDDVRLAEAEARLPAFARVHHRLLVRTDIVRDVLPNEHGDFRVLLDDGQDLPMSRRYRGRVLG